MLVSAGWEAQASAQSAARTYPVVTAHIPFQFAVGRRKFKSGNYQFVVLGPGLLAVLNTKTRGFVRFTTRDAQLIEVPATTRLNFTNSGKRYRQLTSMLLEGHARGLEIVGEEAAVRQNPPWAAPPMPVELFVPRSKLPLRP
jgi:hypothetical protein